MPLTKLQFASGIQADVTGLSAMGRWADADRVRFRKAIGDAAPFPEKIGGWRSYASGYLGEASSLHLWSSLAGDRYLGLATTYKAYVESSAVLTDITPTRRTLTLAANPFLPTGGGSSIVTVTDVGHGAQVNDFVRYSGTTTGQITAAVMNTEYQVLTVVDTDHYTINTATTVAPAGVAFGGAAVVATYQIHVGVNVSLVGTGYGTGPYGRGTYGSPYTTANYNYRVWSQDNFGEDEVLLPNFSEPYLWRPSLGLTANPAVAISGLTGANSAPIAGLLIFVTDERHVVILGANDFGQDAQDPMVVRWSAQEDYLDWEPRPDNTSGSLRLAVGSTIVAFSKQLTQTLIWTDRALYVMQFAGPPYTFAFQQVSTDLSIIGPRGAISASSSTFWMDSRQFYYYNGQVVQLECPVLGKVFGDFNWAQRAKVAAGLNSQFSEVWWHYPSASSTVNDRYVSHNYQTGDWMIGTLTREAWHDKALDGLPVAAYGGDLFQHEYGSDDDGAEMNEYIESGEMDLADGERLALIKRLIPDFKITGDCACMEIQIKGRDYPNQTLLTKATLEIEEDTTERDVRIRNRQIALRFGDSDIGTAWRYGAVRLEVQPDGRR